MIEPRRLIITTLSFLSGSRRNLDHSPAQRGRHSNGGPSGPAFSIWSIPTKRTPADAAGSHTARNSPDSRPNRRLCDLEPLSARTGTAQIFISARVCAYTPPATSLCRRCRNWHAHRCNRQRVTAVAILHSRAVAFSTRHRLQDQSVADRVRHRAVYRHRDTLGSDRQRGRRVRSTVLREVRASSALIAPAGLVGAANRCAG
jgi:hypothetical protein